MDAATLEHLPLPELLAWRHPRNPKDHDLDDIEASILRFGFTIPILLCERTGRIAAGHGRLAVLERMHDRGADVPARVGVTPDGVWMPPVVRGWESADDDELLAYVIADNRTTQQGGWLPDVLADVLQELAATDAGLPPGFDHDDLDQLLAELSPVDPDAAADRPPPNPPLADRFVMVPFSVLNARSGEWQERKRRWLTLGIEAEVARDDELTMGSPHAWLPGYYDDKAAVEERLGRTLSRAEYERDHMRVSATASITAGGTSVFDPVLCELAYRWFSGPGARVLDPFAGGSVRGILAAALGRHYTGLDLSTRQVDANVAQAADILPLLDQATAGDATVDVKVSAASMRQRFHGCEPDFIRDVCRAACCHSASAPGGALVTIHPSEQAAIEARGYTVEHGLLQPPPGTTGCPAEDRDSHLCGLHDTPDKPFGCIASPLTVNANGTLIVRNRYRLLPCYRQPRADGTTLPVYEAFRASLVHLFGPDTTDLIVSHLAAGGGDLTVPMPAATYRTLRDNDGIKHGDQPVTPAADHPAPQWHVADAHAWLSNPNTDTGPYDLLFSCPPYADLERYSDDPRDLSAMPWPDFLASYRAIIAGAVDRLAPNRFAVWVVGEVRDDRGRYRGLVPATVEAFTDAGCTFHNEGILVTPVGALPVLVGRQFPPARRMVKTHQQVLVFVKGDPRKAAAAAGPVDVATGEEIITANR